MCSQEGATNEECLPPHQAGIQRRAQLTLAALRPAHEEMAEGNGSSRYSFLSRRGFQTKVERLAERAIFQ